MAAGREMTIKTSQPLKTLVETATRVPPPATLRSSFTVNRGFSAMFIAMNRFKVLPGAEMAFEEVWTARETHLPGVPGFIAFHLLRGPVHEDHVLYASHTLWRDRAAFEDWTRSDAFRLAHRNAGGNKPLYLGHPEFEGFDVIQTVG